MQKRVFLIHWKGPEAEGHARLLREAGWQVEVESEDGGRAVKRILSERPDGVVISLRRLPSHGRETARALRERKAGSSVPIFFTDGNAEAVERARSVVPDAVFTPWSDLVSALATRLEAPPHAPPETWEARTIVRLARGHAPLAAWPALRQDA